MAAMSVFFFVKVNNFCYLYFLMESNSSDTSSSKKARLKGFQTLFCESVSGRNSNKVDFYFV